MVIIPDGRPVICLLCHEQLYYAGDERYEPEIELQAFSHNLSPCLQGFQYVHERCYLRILYLARGLHIKNDLL